MTPLSALLSVVTTACVLLMLYIATYFFFTKIYTPYKKNSIVLSYTECFTILGTLINSEIDEYENDLFQNKTSITNSNFENFYRDMTTKIISNLSPQMVSNMSCYVGEDVIYRMIAKSVKTYLINKI